jgi:hypothetical protein
MTIQTFAVDADSIRRHYFPHLDSFSASTSPTLATVTERITRAAARLSGQLYMRNVDPTTIVDTTSPAWAWCQETLSLIVAIRLAQVVSGANSEAVKAWQADLTERFHVLSDSGEAALGGGADAFGLSESAGPTDFISELSLDVGDTSLASDVSPVLRRSDLL